MIYKNVISIDPAIRSGKPCIANTRITVGDILEYMASGMTAQKIIHDFPELTEQHLHACLAFAASRERLLHQAAIG